jgi:hypothetical protein
MHASVLLVAIAMQAAIVIDVEPHAEVEIQRFILAVRLGNMIYGADFLADQTLKATDFMIGERLHVVVKHGKMTLRGRTGRLQTATIVREERVILEPR